MSGDCRPHLRSSLPPPNILECFENYLPILSREHDTRDSTRKYHSASGPTIARFQPPKVLLHKSMVPLIEHTDRILHSLKRNPKLHLDVLRDVSPFDELILSQEGDLVKAAALYLLRPVMEVLRILYPGCWRVRSEFPSYLNTAIGSASPLPKSSRMDKTARMPIGTPNSNISAGTQAPTTNLNGAVRLDLVFQTKISNDPAEEKVMAIIEFKKPNTITYPDIASAILSSSSSKQQVEALIQRLDDASEESFLRHSSQPYFKQIATYAKAEDCKYAAIFNWDHLIFVKFAELHKAEPKSAGDIANLMWVNERGGPTAWRSETCQHLGPYMENFPMRKALLGFLIVAFDEHLKR